MLEKIITKYTKCSQSSWGGNLVVTKMCQKRQHCMEQPALFIFHFRSRLNLMRKKCTDKYLEFKIGAYIAERAKHNRRFIKKSGAK